MTIRTIAHLVNDVMNSIFGLYVAPSGPMGLRMSKMASNLATTSHIVESARYLPGQMLQSVSSSAFRENPSISHRLPHPKIAFSENTSPSPAGDGKKRSDLNDKGSMCFFSSNVIALWEMPNSIEVSRSCRMLPTCCWRGLLRPLG